MNTKKIILLLVALFLLAGCNSSGGKKTSKASSSQPASKTNQPIPSYPDLPSYPDYDPSDAGIAPNHISAISITPNEQYYARVGDVFNVTSSVSTALVNEETNEKVITYSVDKDNYVSVSPYITDKGAYNATISCLAPGDVTLTASSIEGRYKRNCLIHIVPATDEYDIYDPALSMDKGKGKFGWVEKRYFNGDTAGIAQFGRNLWKFRRSNPSNIGSYSGAIAFGSSNYPEGSLEFSTIFQYPVESVIINCSSAPGRDTSSGSNLPYGSSSIDSWIGDDHFDITIAGKKYSPTSEIHTAKGTDDASYTEHVIDCKNMSGEFHVKLGASIGYIRFKSIVVKYASREFPEGNVSTAYINFDDVTFQSTPGAAFKKNSCSDSNNLVDVAFTYIKEKDSAVENHYPMRSNSTMIITPKDSSKTIKKVNALFAPYTSTQEEVEKVIENKINVRESYTSAEVILDNYSFKQNNIVLTNMSFGTNWVEIKNAQTENSGFHLGLVSLSVKLTDAIEAATCKELTIEGTILKDVYDFESTTYRDAFKDRGCCVTASFTNEMLMPVMVNSTNSNFSTLKKTFSWGDLTIGQTNVVGTCSSGICKGKSVTYEGFTVHQHSNLSWTKSTSVGDGQYLIISRNTNRCFSGLGTNSEMQAGTTDFDVEFESDGSISGTYIY